MFLFLAIALLVGIACGGEPWDPSGFSLEEFGIGRKKLPIKSPEASVDQGDAVSPKCLPNPHQLV